MKWFRFYTDALNNPKVQSLDGELFKFWINILCVTSQCNGVLPSHDEIAFYLRIPKEKVTQLLDILIERKLIDKGDSLKPHNWEKRQYKSDTSNERTRKYRERKKKEYDENNGVTCDVTVAPSDTENTDTDIYINNMSRSSEQDVSTLKKSKPNYQEDAKDLLAFLNQKAARDFRPVDSNLKPIIARLKTGVTPLDIRRVIITKVDEWLKSDKPEFSNLQYASPDTLFRPSKFEKYLAQMKQRFGGINND